MEQAIRDLQTLLTAISQVYREIPRLKPDGIFGEETLEAVMRFQENNGLSVDGIAGPETLTLLAARAADPTTPELPDDGEAPNVYDGYVLMDYETAITVRKQLKNALEIIENAIGDAKP